MSDSKPVDPWHIADEEHLKVVRLPLDGAEAIFANKKRKIILSDRITNEGRRNFTLCHELGHWFLHRDRNQAYLCTKDDISGYTTSAMEVEANAFASELMLPASRAAEIVAHSDVSFATAVRVSRHFQMSVTAVLMALVAVTKRSRILVSCKDDRIVWFKKSPGADNRYILRGHQVDVDSAAYGCTTELSDLNDDELRELPVEVISSLWIPEDYGVDDWQMTEEALWLPYQHTVLAVLSLELRYDDE